MAERSGIYLEPYMISLKLPMTELLVYALIKQFSQAKQGCYHGSQRYLAEQTEVTRQAVNKALISLECKGLIEKRDNCGRIEYSITGATVVAGVQLEAKNASTTVAYVQLDEQPQLTEVATTVDKGATSVDENVNYGCESVNHSCTNINKYKINKKGNENVNTHTHASHQNTVRKLEPIATNDFCDTGFESPTLEQVKAYVTEAGLCIDPVQFWNYYTARNWTNPTSGRRLDYWQGNAQSWHDREAKEKRNGSKESEKEKRARLADERLKEIFGKRDA